MMERQTEGSTEWRADCVIASNKEKLYQIAFTSGYKVGGGRWLTMRVIIQRGIHSLVILSSHFSIELSSVLKQTAHIFSIDLR